MIDPLWSPAPDRIERARITRFMQFVQERYQAPVRNYPTLHLWSVEFPENFWTAVWDFCEVRAQTRATQVLKDGNRMPGARWFIGAQLNYAENLLRLADDSTAIVFRNERGGRRELSWRELHAETARIADGLRAAGVKPGDRVAGYLPNMPETVIAMLATTSLGAIWSSCSPDLELSGALDRFGQLTPRVLFAVDVYQYAGNTIDCTETVRAVREQVSSIEQLVLVPYLDEQIALDGAIRFDAYGRAGEPLTFAHLPFEQPGFVLYSSRTDCTPKYIVHGAGGALIQQLKEHVLHSDVGRGDRVMYDTTCDGELWNALVSALGAGATIVLYDGAPLHPDPRPLWRIAQEEQVTVFGTSPRFLVASEQAAIRPGRDFDLSALKTIISSGSKLHADSYRYVYRDVKQDVLLASIAGAADIMACFGSGCPIVPVHEGETQVLSLGMKSQVYDDAGKPLVGEQGELVCSAPFPSVPIGFWGDIDGSRLRATYFERYPNVWWQGDLATITENGGLIVHARCDT